MIDKTLAKLRESRGISKKEVARILDVHESTYGKYELGHRTPDNDTLVRLADYYNVTVDYLLGRTDENTVQLVKASPTLEEALANEGITNPEYIKALKKIVELMRKDAHNAEIADELMEKGFGKS